MNRADQLISLMLDEGGLPPGAVKPSKLPKVTSVESPKPAFDKNREIDVENHPSKKSFPGRGNFAGEDNEGKKKSGWK